MYAYCTEVLHMSEGAAYHRIQVARAGRRVPALLDRIRRGELHLSGAVLLAPKLTAGTASELLDLARHRSKRAIEELLADREPKPDAPAVVRKEHVRAPAPASVSADARPSTVAPPPAPPDRAVPASRHPAPAPQIRHPEPLGRERYKIQFTANRELCHKLREARALLRHQVPDGDLAEIFDRALTSLVKEVRRKKFADVKKPRSQQATKRDRRSTRHIPAGIRRAVTARDQERCAFIGSSGHRCGSQDFLEFHHREPWGRSKRHSVSNIELRCRAHNRYAAVQDFGADHMARFRPSNTRELSPGTVEQHGPPEGLD